MKAAAAGGGTIVLAASWLPWFRGMSGFAAANRVLAASLVEGVPPRWVVACWYAMPLSACALWLVAIGVAAPRWSLMAPVLCLVVSWATFSWLVLASGEGELVGPLAAGVGVLLAVAATQRLTVLGRSGSSRLGG